MRGCKLAMITGWMAAMGMLAAGVRAENAQPVDAASLAAPQPRQVEIALAPAVVARPERACTVRKTPEQLRGVHALNLWPDNLVPYAFNANVSAAQQAAAVSAMGIIEDATAIDFIPRTTQGDYIVFRDAGGNSSYVGRIGGAQTINIYNWNIPLIIVHECMHALGIFHEQSRPDRDDYVQINYANISQTACGGPCDYNFDIEPTATMVGPYDFESVMHYGQCSFSVCSNCFLSPSGCRTITVLPPYAATWQDQIGQRDNLSAGDILTMQTMYPTFSEPCESVIGDLDSDADVDLADFHVFQGCYADGADGRPECACADANDDGFINAADVESFVAAIHGPGQLLGACCDELNGACTEGSAVECTAANGTYQGDGAGCAETNCPIANAGACCDPDTMSCTQTSELFCSAAGNLYKGDGTVCDGAACPLEYSNTDSMSSFLVYSPGANIPFADDLTLAGTARQLLYYDLTVFTGTGNPFDVTVGLHTACPGAGGTLIPGTQQVFNSSAGPGPVVLSAVFPGITLPDTVWMQVEFAQSTAQWTFGFEAEVGSTAYDFAIDQSPWNCDAFFGGEYAGFRARLFCAE